MKIKLWLDDERTEPVGWMRSTTGENCIELLQLFAGLISDLAFDHDLDDHVDTRHGYGEPGPLTGYDVAVWLEDQASKGRWAVVPERMTCHSANPQGRQRILQAIASIQKMRDKQEK